MDSQDILAWGEVKSDWIGEEYKRLVGLCEWGIGYGIDGFVRCVSAFRMMPIVFFVYNHLPKDGNGFVSCMPERLAASCCI